MTFVNCSTWRLLALVIPCFVLAVGCDDSDARKYEVSGKVTYDGKPVPKGFITLIPDSEKGNSGPGGGATIVDGTYQSEKGKGIVGGAYRVEIVGFDGVAGQSEDGEELADGKPLFPKYTTTVEFPMDDATKDFEIPTTEAPKD